MLGSKVYHVSLATILLILFSASRTELLCYITYFIFYIRNRITMLYYLFYFLHPEQNYYAILLILFSTSGTELLYYITYFILYIQNRITILYYYIISLVFPEQNYVTAIFNNRLVLLLHELKTACDYESLRIIYKTFLNAILNLLKRLLCMVR